VKGAQGLDRFGHSTSCVVCFSLDGDWVISYLEGVPVRPYIGWGDRFT
jgi:hypothetical protein